ncbi:hypothetical protein MATL_G00101290 [Megalops atlanticus]|uniref:Uncharacterized protein n=1 Tax=Megalops atlanticus TaxID=7932 RepID=A0A9D3Q798_MEGAT|nr:hypothetical protein MATL_G00101290 [Megalops atlanticus]
MVLPNQMGDDDNKALGLGYIVEEDKLHVMTSIDFSKRKKKMRLGQNLLQEQYNKNYQDLNTRATWECRFAGRGRVVTILDDGIEKDHPDLVDNYDLDSSYDVIDGDSDPQSQCTELNDNSSCSAPQ